MDKFEPLALDIGVPAVRSNRSPLSLVDRFLEPPFDTLDARQARWRERKRKWLDLGIASASGRDAAATADAPRRDADFYDKKDAMSRQLGRELTSAEFKANYYTTDGDAALSGTSIFDPVICELMYRWYSKPGDLVYDPFAGGSVRGLVAGMLGRSYTGVDLSQRQVDANREQAAAFADRDMLQGLVMWSEGDSATWPYERGMVTADLVFTCPPYYDLERYSDDPRDLSTLGGRDFEVKYAEVIAACYAALRNDRFAVFVTGDTRDRKGNLRHMSGLTVRAATQAGFTLVSAAVLLTPVGSAKISAARNLLSGGTLNRTHQNVLVFCKGNRKKAAGRRGEVCVSEPGKCP